MTITTGDTITRKPLPCPACRRPMTTRYLIAGDLVIPLRLICTTLDCRNNTPRT